MLADFKALRDIADIRQNWVRKKLPSVLDCQGNLRVERQGIADAFAEFYEVLYGDDSIIGNASRLEVGSGEVPGVEPSEVRKQLRQMAKNKSADGSGLVVEMLQEAGDGVISLVADIFNDVLLRNYTPEGWRRTRIKVLLKKGDARILDNYRPISILPILYKLFTRVL